MNSPLRTDSSSCCTDKTTNQSHIRLKQKDPFRAPSHLNQTLSGIRTNNFSCLFELRFPKHSFTFSTYILRRAVVLWQLLFFSLRYQYIESLNFKPRHRSVWHIRKKRWLERSFLCSYTVHLRSYYRRGVASWLQRVANYVSDLGIGPFSLVFNSSVFLWPAIAYEPTFWGTPLSLNCKSLLFLMALSAWGSAFSTKTYYRHGAVSSWLLVCWLSAIASAKCSKDLFRS